MPQKKKRFVFNDESVKNSYGFYIQTDGIDTRRFEQNPVCLADHWNFTGSVMGTWGELKSENGNLSGEPIFDTTKHEEIVRQVNNGTIKACSMGILFDEADFIRNDDGDLILTKCELMEVSIVAVPSNANSIALYHQNGVQLTENEVKTVCLNASKATPFTPENSTNNTDLNMKKIQLSLMAFVALGFAQNTQSVEEPELEKAVLDLKAKADKDAAEVQRLTQELKAYQDAEKVANDQKIDAMIKLAVQEGRITADKEQTYRDLAATNFKLAEDTLNSFEKKKDLSGNINTPSGTSEPMTEEKFMELSSEAQLAWKNENPEAYQKLFA